MLGLGEFISYMAFLIAGAILGYHNYRKEKRKRRWCRRKRRRKPRW